MDFFSCFRARSTWTESAPAKTLLDGRERAAARG
ncbi:hypothetical protein [Sporisorium scitamineum]|uniref:Uncharacterized protein n=1 Tax=Sporisorium scitamineum TaxID=49012 RepID=A0A0F7SB28_9BASI|nr:hypothetical protein [Sporisorium scitamineum]